MNIIIININNGKVTTKNISSNEVVKCSIVDSGVKLWFAVMDTNGVYNTFKKYRGMPSTIVEELSECTHFEDIQLLLNKDAGFSPKDKNKTKIVNYTHAEFLDIANKKRYSVVTEQDML